MDNVLPMYPSPIPQNNCRVPDRQNGLLLLTLRVAEANLVRAAGLDARHHLGDGRVAVFSQAVDAASDQKAGSEFLRQAEKFIDIAFPITDMYAATGGPRQFGGPAQIVEPAHAFLLVDRHPGGVDLAFQRGGSLELVARPELGRRQAERQPLRRDGKAGMHQQAADRMLLMAALLQLSSGRNVCESDLLRCGALEGELCRVLQDQDRAISGPDPQASGRKMALEDLVLTDILVGEEPIGGLRVGPVLKRRGQRRPRSFTYRLQNRPEPAVQPCITQIAFRDFIAHPTVPHESTRIIEGARERITLDSTRSREKSSRQKLMGNFKRVHRLQHPAKSLWVTSSRFEPPACGCPWEL